METCEPEDSDPEEDDHELQNDETQSWIGVIHIPVLEYYYARGSKSCSVLERVCAWVFCFRVFTCLPKFRDLRTWETLELEQEWGELVQGVLPDPRVLPWQIRLAVEEMPFHSENIAK